MSQLAKLQQNFQDCVLKQSDSKAPAWVSMVGRARPEVQLSVYSHAYRARLKEVLASDYTVVHMAIGEDAFDKLAETYIQDCPSKYFSLRDFGGRLPEFINHSLHPGVVLPNQKIKLLLKVNPSVGLLMTARPIVSLL